MLTLTDPHQKHRAEALTLYGMGLTPNEIATAQAVHPNTIYRDLQAFAQVGLEAITQLCASGAPRQITEHQIAQIVQLATQSPQEVGLPYGRWSLRKLRAYLLKRRMIKALGRERLRQLLKKRLLLSTDTTQTGQSGSAPTDNSGTYPLDFQAFAHRWGADFLRCQADCGQSLWRTTVHHRHASGLAASSKNARLLLSLYLLSRDQRSSALDVFARQGRSVRKAVYASLTTLVS
jgi:transposase